MPAGVDIILISSWLKELWGEKEDLDAYQKLDWDQRAVEYTLYDKGLHCSK